MNNTVSLLSEKERALLVVEDSESNIALTQLYFSKTACRLDIAKNGQEAVEMFESGNYEAILMDIHMPIMDGYTATRRIRDIEAKRGTTPIPIIAVTANIHNEEQERCCGAGCNDFLSKPVSKSDLLSTVAKHLEQIR